MIVDEKVDFYGQSITDQQQVLQMKVEEINRLSMQNQINRRQANPSQLIIEEITARKEQSENASKQDSVMVPQHHSSQNQLSWSQVSTDQKVEIGSKGDTSMARVNSSKPKRRGGGEQNPYVDSGVQKSGSIE